MDLSQYILNLMFWQNVEILAKISSILTYSFERFTDMLTIYIGKNSLWLFFEFSFDELGGFNSSLKEL